MIVAAPQVSGGKTTDALVYLFDVLPTICDLTGIPVPGSVDGKSLLPILTGEAKGVRESIVTTYRDVQRAVRDNRWKLIRYPQADMKQLFDLLADPQETLNLAEDKQQRQRVREMVYLLREWQRRYGDTVIL